MRSSPLIVLGACIALAGCGQHAAVNPFLPAPGQPAPLDGRFGGVHSDLSQNHITAIYDLISTIAGPYYMTNGPDGNIWFSEDFVQKIARITPTGTITEFLLANHSNPMGIAAGPDGNLWFTVVGAHVIGKITTGGTVSLLAEPAVMGARGITPGPDGNVWFADTASHSIGVVTPAGVVTEYKVGTNAKPYNIVTGPDHNLWFTDIQGKIGKITPAGVITEFGGGLSADSITASPDGNLYASGGSNVYKVTTAGVITSASLASAGVTKTFDLAPGPDGQIWITVTAGTPTGILEYNPVNGKVSPTATLPNGECCAEAITQGPDGDMWFTKYSFSTIGYVGVYDESLSTVGIYLTGRAKVTDPTYGVINGYFNGTKSPVAQIISVPMGESVEFDNLDPQKPHMASFIGNATQNGAPWPPVDQFPGSTVQSPANTVISTSTFSTGNLNPGQMSLPYETGGPGFFMIGCEYHYDDRMRTVVIVH